MRLIDVASWQGALNPDDVARAGMHAVNLKISHGLTLKSVHPNVAGWVDAARRLALGLCSFHFLTAGDGAAQADYAYSRIVALGLQRGTAHACDCEADASLATVTAYLQRMRQLLGRPVALYTGRWWWQPKGWGGAALSPYLWAAPNTGYLSAYPGDDAPAWSTVDPSYAPSGWGGWDERALLQYAVQPLTFPDTNTAGLIDVSQTAIRNPGVWAALTGLGDLMTYAPSSCLAVRREFQLRTSLTDSALGVVGDDNHTASGSSYHLGRSALRSDSYTITESSRDRNGLTDAASANDIGWFSIGVDGKTHNLRTFSVWLVAECRALAPDTLDIREIIYSPDGQSVRRWDRLGIRSSGDNSHLSHTHISWFRDSEYRDRAAVIRRYFREIQGIDMALTNTDADVFLNRDGITNDINPTVDNPKMTVAWALRYATRAELVRRELAEVRATVLAQMKLMQTALTAAIANADDGAAVVAAIREESSRLQLAAAQDAARDVAAAAAINTAVTELKAIREQLEAAGGDPDLAPVVERLDALTEKIGTAGREAATQAAADVISRLAAAQDAEAAALRGQG